MSFLKKETLRIDELTSYNLVNNDDIIHIKKVTNDKIIKDISKYYLDILNDIQYKILLNTIVKKINNIVLTGFFSAINTIDKQQYFNLKTNSGTPEYLKSVFATFIDEFNYHSDYVKNIITYIKDYTYSDDDNLLKEYILTNNSFKFFIECLKLNNIKTTEFNKKSKEFDKIKLNLLDIISTKPLIDDNTKKILKDIFNDIKDGKITSIQINTFNNYLFGNLKKIIMDEKNKIVIHKLFIYKKFNSHNKLEYHLAVIDTAQEDQIKQKLNIYSKYEYKYLKYKEKYLELKAITK